MHPNQCPSSLKYFLCDGKGVYGVGPSCIKSQVRDHLHDFVLGDTVVTRTSKMRPQLFWPIQGNHCSDSDETSIALGKSGTLPNISVKHIVR